MSKQRLVCQWNPDAHKMRRGSAIEAAFTMLIGVPQALAIRDLDAADDCCGGAVGWMVALAGAALSVYRWRDGRPLENA